MTTAALYARISQDELHDDDDPTKGRKGVQRQLEDARALAEQRGWEIVGEYSDNDISAFSGAYRPQYARLLADAEAKRFSHIVVWHPSRIWRRRPERVEAIETLRRLQIGITCVRGPELDLTSSYGRSMAVIMGEFDTAESEIKAERVARASLQRAQEGRANARIAFGWRREYETNDAGRRNGGFRDVVHPEQAAIVRDLGKRLLAGESLSGMVKDLNARGVPSPSGRPWQANMIRHLVQRPGNVALRVHQGKVIGPAAWPAIVDQDQHVRVTELLAATERRQQRDGKRRYLLTHGAGIGSCGVCGGTLERNTGRRGAGAATYSIYRCAGRGCVTRRLDKVDALVGAVVVERLSRPDAAGIFDADDSAAQAAREKAAAVRARLNNAATDYANGDIDGQQLRLITARLRPDLDALEAEVRRHRPIALPADVDELLGEKAAQAWEALPVVGKRAVLQIIGLQVAIMPRKKSGPGFDPEEIVFRERRDSPELS